MQSRRWRVSLGIGLLMVFVPMWIISAEPREMTSRYAIADVVDLVSLGVVNVTVTLPTARGRTTGLTSSGSGFIVTNDGLVLTNDHVVTGAEKIKVTLFDGTEIDNVELVGTDAQSDIAILQLPEIPYLTGLPTVSLGDSDQLRVGEWVIAFGSPFAVHLGTQLSVTAGIISTLNRNIESGGMLYREFLQTDTAINPGNSGGPLVNLEGEVVGINTAIIPFAQGIGFAIPINRAKSIMEQLLTHGKVLRPWLGVNVTGVSEATAEEQGLSQPRGGKVTGVLRRSPAEKGGIRVGDIVIEINRQIVYGPQDVSHIISRMDVGERAVIVILRDGYRINLMIEIEAEPVS